MSEAAVAEATQVTTPETQAPAVTEPVEELLSPAATQDAVVQNPVGGDTEPEAPVDDHLQKALEAAKKAAAEETEARLKREYEEEQRNSQQYNEYQSYLSGVTQSFQQRAPQIRNALSQWGLDEGQTNWVLNQFNEHHAQAATARDYEYERALRAFVQAEFGQEAISEIETARRTGKLRNYQDILKDVLGRNTKRSQDGWLSPTQVEARIAEGIAKGIDDYKASNPLPGAPATNGRRTAAPNMTYEQADAAFNRGDITADQWMAIVEPRENPRR